jgi:hypothetical protein
MRAGPFGVQCPAFENGWHGGPPAMSVTSDRRSPAVRRARAGSRAIAIASLGSACCHWGRLRRSVARAGSLFSTHNRVRNPALSRPISRPPAPVNKERTPGPVRMATCRAEGLVERFSWAAILHRAGRKVELAVQAFKVGLATRSWPGHASCGSGAARYSARRRCALDGGRLASVPAVSCDRAIMRIGRLLEWPCPP